MLNVHQTSGRVLLLVSYLFSTVSFISHVCAKAERFRKFALLLIGGGGGDGQTNEFA